MPSTDERRDRQQLTILPLAACLELIDSVPLGRIGFTSNGRQLILPVTHTRRGLLVSFRAASGAKADAARSATEIAFEVDGYDPNTRTGWSDLGVGRAGLADEIMTGHLEASELEPLADAAPRDHWVVIALRDITGRRVGPSDDG
jgi:nitroimidazol reductase NimA-like FMN-containing flavoprotein (pyridoxamine 5'-phosphate oxidase superfamily)